MSVMPNINYPTAQLVDQAGVDVVLVGFPGVPAAYEAVLRSALAEMVQVPIRSERTSSNFTFAISDIRNVVLRFFRCHYTGCVAP